MKKIISLILCAIFFVLPINISSAAVAYSVVAEPVFNMADSFYSNVTKVSKNSLWGICDTNGYVITGFRWEAMGEIVDSLIPAKSNGLWGYISYEGEVKIPYQFKSADNFSNDLARVITKEDKFAYINRSGNKVFTSPFDYSFAPSEGFIAGIKDGMYGYCDTNGNMAIHPQFNMGLDFHDGLAAVKFGGKWGYISGEGKYVVKPTYTHASDFSGGFAVCSTSTGYGIINSSGKKTSPFTFEYIGTCDEGGRFPAKRAGVCGYINSSGEWLMKLDYDFCYEFTNGVARVFKNNLWGYIDESGKEIIKPSFADAGEYRNGRMIYSKDGLTYGILKLNTLIGENSQQTNTSYKSYEELIKNEPQNAVPSKPTKDKCVSLRIGSKFAVRKNNIKTLSAAPVLINGVSMVPLRDLVEYMGGQLKWEEAKQKINISFNNRRIIMTVGSKIAYVDGTSKSISTAPVLIDGVTMIPVRSAVTALSCKVEWVGETQNIYIYY